MATVKLKFRPSTLTGREGTLFFQVVHQRMVRHIKVGYRAFPEEWDAQEHRLVVPLQAESERKLYLSRLQMKVEEDKLRIEWIIRNLETEGIGFDAEQIVSIFYKTDCNGGIIAFGRRLVVDLKRQGYSRTSETYLTAVNSFIRFRGYDGEVLLEDLDVDVIGCYETYLKSMGIMLNSISYYMRNLRAIYNRAVEAGLTTQRHPFRHVYTGICKTQKRAVPLKMINRIKHCRLRKKSGEDFARDLFMFSFYTRGMSFVDMAFLKKTDLKDGMLVYRRKKTGQRLTIKWEYPMQQIVDKYDTGSQPYLLPIIRCVDTDSRKQYLNALHRVNTSLRKIGRSLGLPVTLTTYVARHSWASIALSKQVPVSVISEGMGHDSEITTRIYLASLDTSAVDQANRRILDFIE